MSDVACATTTTSVGGLSAADGAGDGVGEADTPPVDGGAVTTAEPGTRPGGALPRAAWPVTIPTPVSAAVRTTAVEILRGRYGMIRGWSIQRLPSRHG